MRKNIYILRRTENETVTSHNFDIIYNASIATGCKVVDFATMDQCKSQGKRNDIFVVTTCKDAIILYLSGRKKLFFWVQGIVPEESYMRHHNRIRYWLLSFVEKLSLKYSSCTACVSKAMIEHFEKKYKLNLREKSYIFPCFNATIEEAAFMDKDKYTNNVFTYAGGLAEWQCFNETLDIYKKLEDLNIKGTKLQILTKNKELAEKEIWKRGIKNYEIGFYPKEELPKVMGKSKFGFVIRKPDPVNEVSTPTKISTYLSCGLIPIYGECIKSFKEQSRDMKYVVEWAEDKDSFNKVVSLMKDEINNNDVFLEFGKIFDRYFSDSLHKESITGILNKMMNEKN